MTDWLKRMIERCMKRRSEGVCDTCHLRRVCLHRAVPAAAAHAPPAAAADHPLAGLVGAIAALFDADRRPPVQRAVEQELERRLADGPVSVETVAAALSMTRATLYRRLRAEGTSYEQLLDQVRHRLARRYLEKEARSVKDTAYRLGFSDPSAFSRAFKRWTGQSPSEVRA